MNNRMRKRTSRAERRRAQRLEQKTTIPKGCSRNYTGTAMAGLFVVAVVGVMLWRGAGDRSESTGAAGVARSPIPAEAPVPEPPEKRASGVTTSALPPGLSADDKASLFLNRGNELLELGDVNEAIASYEEAMRLTPEDENVHFNLAVALVRANRLEDAEQFYRSGLEIFEDYPEIHNNLGNLLVRLNRLDEAEEHLREAIRLWPEYAKAHNNLGTALGHQGNQEESLSHFQEAVKHEPDYWEAWFNIGVAQMALNNLEPAEAAFREVLSRQPDFTAAQEALKRMEERLRQPEPIR
jgi:Flp pilus assembly protein TadD